MFTFIVKLVKMLQKYYMLFVTGTWNTLWISAVTVLLGVAVLALQNSSRPRWTWCSTSLSLLLGHLGCSVNVRLWQALQLLQ